MTDEPEASPGPEAEPDATTARALSVLKARHPLDAARWEALGPSFLEVAGGKRALHPSFAVFSLLLRHGHDEPDGLLGVASHDRLLAPLLELGTSRLWGELSAGLRREPKARHASLLAELLERERASSKARLAAQATLQRLLPSLAWALPSLVPLRARVALRAAAARDDEDLRQLTAYTDGRDIFLPSRIALFEAPAHNELAFVRLLVHEALHLSEGSFAALACQQAERHVFRRLRAQGLLAPGSRRGAPPTLRSISELFGEHAELFFSLLNCVEDSRIERSLPQYLPGFTDVAEYVDQAVRALAPPAAFEPAPTQLLRGVLDELMGRPAPIPAAFAVPFAEVRAAIAAFHALLRPTLAESIPLATELCLWFLRHVAAEPRAQLTEVLRRRRPVSAKAYEHHVELRPLGRRPVSELRPRMNLGHVSVLSSDGVIVPEYDLWESRVRERGASVEEHPWDPLRAGVVGRAVRCEAAMAEARSVPRSSFRPSGARLDPRRLVRLLATQKAGGAPDGRVFRGREVLRDDAYATVVVDLSVSMVHYRPDGARPLERAVGWLEDLAGRLGDGAPLTLWGCVDGGPEKVRMFRLKERGEPLHRATLESLHGYSLGGFRMGAIVRWLAARATASERTRVFLVTDAGSHYVTRGVRRAWNFERELCADCPRPGSLCDLERSFPDELWIGERATIFEPLEYEVEDIRHALATTAHAIDPHVILLTEHWGDDLCDYTFGPGRWSKV